MPDVRKTLCGFDFERSPEIALDEAAQCRLSVPVVLTCVDMCRNVPTGLWQSSAAAVVVQWVTAVGHFSAQVRRPMKLQADQRGRCNCASMVPLHL